MGQQGHTSGQQPSLSPASYPTQGTTQPGYGIPPTSQAGYGNQPPTQPGYGLGYGAPQAQKPLANPLVYGQPTQSPGDTLGGYGQLDPVQPGYPHSQPPTASYGQPDSSLQHPIMVLQLVSQVMRLHLQGRRKKKMELEVVKAELVLPTHLSFKQIQMYEKYPKGQSRGRHWKHLKQILQAENHQNYPPDEPNYINIESPLSMHPCKRICDITRYEVCGFLDKMWYYRHNQCIYDFLCKW
ncbi:uncharacterized protein LOC136068768 [Quercus suber]|uniref:uncharacterized protein LOC136068768 n=1 Tax=Quercus suber TaxID=58331 RepID=UPI0032DF117E